MATDHEELRGSKGGSRWGGGLAACPCRALRGFLFLVVFDGGLAKRSKLSVVEDSFEELKLNLSSPQGPSLKSLDKLAISSITFFYLSKDRHQLDNPLFRKNNG